MKLPYLHKTKEETKRRGRGIFLFATVLALSVVCLYSALDKGPKDGAGSALIGNFLPPQGDAVQGHLPNMTEEEIMEQMQKEADSSAFSFKLNAWPVFRNGGKAGTLLIENPKHNTYPFVVEIFLKETGEKIYDSGAIHPDHHIERASLTRRLLPGTHAATAHVSAYDPDSEEFRGKAVVEMSLTIEM